MLAAISAGFSPRPARSPKPRLRLCFEKQVTMRSPKPLSPVEVSAWAPQAAPRRRVSTIALVTRAALPDALILTNGVLQIHDLTATNAQMRFYRIIENKN